MQAGEIRKIAIALKLSFASHRDILHGVSCYAKSHRWQLQFIGEPETLTVRQLETLERYGVNGFLTCGCEGASMRFFEGSSTPLVITSSRADSNMQRTRNIGFVGTDDIDIGQFGASYLSSLGQFRSFGFVPENTPRPASKLRSRGFIKHFGKSAKVSIFTGKDVDNGSEEDLLNLSAWLVRLPKPAAIMAVYDLRASQVLEAARRSGLSVPAQLSVISVDNDELLCNFTEPSLTSITPDYVNLGELAADKLNRLMSTGTFRHPIIAMSAIKTIHERESTAPTAPASALVDRALSFIRKNALSGITSSDVVVHLGVSRRLADQRFRETTGTSMLETILGLRIDAIKEKLASSRLTISKITKLCGFANENHAKNLFRRRVGMSMRNYRKCCNSRVGILSSVSKSTATGQ